MRRSRRVLVGAVLAAATLAVAAPAIADPSHLLRADGPTNAHDASLADVNIDVRVVNTGDGRTVVKLRAHGFPEAWRNKTLGAHVLAEAARLAPETAVRESLAAIAAEEATHAVLSFRIAAWALAAGGASVRAAVRAELEKPCPRLDVTELALRAGVETSALQAAADAGVTEVLEPAVRRLLAARPAPARHLQTLS